MKLYIKTTIKTLKIHNERIIEYYIFLFKQHFHVVAYFDKTVNTEWFV